MKDVEVNEVVQLGPNCANPMFRYCFMTITEVKTWGVQGYVQALGENEEPGGQAYYRAPWDQFEKLENNKPVWVAQ